MKRLVRSTLSTLVIAVACFAAANAQTTAFTFQGKLSDSSVAANGIYSIRFDLFAAPTGGTALATQTISSVSVTNGVFTAPLDFGSGIFVGPARFLEITVGSITLSPRQQILSSPYSIRSSKAAVADDSLMLNGVAASQYVLTTDSRLSDARAASSVNFGTAGLTGVVPILHGGTGSSTQNFVDLTNAQSIDGIKTFTNRIVVTNSALPSGNVIAGNNTAPAGTGNGNGVVGITNQASALAAGVFGANSNSNGTGIIATGNNVGSTVLVAGSGLAATGLTTGIYARSTSGGVGEAIFTEQFGSVTRVNFWNGATQFKIIGVGTVSTLVRDTENKTRVMFAPESPEVLFEDYGYGKLTEGRAHIELDPVLAANIAVTASRPLRVFIQLEGDCNGVYVTSKTATGFEVIELSNGTSNVPFSWHVVANRADEELTTTPQADGTVTKRISHYADLRFPLQQEKLSTSTPANISTSIEKRP